MRGAEFIYWAASRLWISPQQPSWSQRVLARIRGRQRNRAQVEAFMAMAEALLDDRRRFIRSRALLRVVTKKTKRQAGCRGIDKRRTLAFGGSSM